jgi:hypothetical protein
MDVSDKVDIVSQLATIQAKISSVDWRHYGSLYYRDGIARCRDVPDFSERFSMGPITPFDFWEQERISMEKYQGPCELYDPFSVDVSLKLTARRDLGSTATSYITSIAEREKEWISQFAKPRNMSDLWRQSDAQESPCCHLQLLDKFLKAMPYLLPPEKELHRPTLWHHDLHAGNIFVEKNQIVSIIDWQASTIIPLFLTCGIPKFLRMDGPLLYDLPPATNLTAREKEETLARYQLTQLQMAYITKLRALDEKGFQAISDPYALDRQQLIDFAGSTWEDDGLFLLQEMLHRTWCGWEEITGQKREDCPISFSPEESLAHAEEGKSWNKFREVFNALGIPFDGWVHPEDFESKVETMRGVVAAVLVQSAENVEEAKAALRAWKLTESRAGSKPGDIMEI